MNTSQHNLTVHELLAHIEAIQHQVAITTATLAPEKRIVVLDKGFVFYGDFWVANGWIHITNALNIRVWGTTKGLGELALTGPTSSTVLDQCADVTAPIHALVWSMPVLTPEPWVAK